MGREFTVEYDDFTGGHFLGDNDVKQPFNTWTGNNVCTTADEGFLMADGGWSSTAQVYSVASSTTGFAALGNPYSNGGHVVRGTAQYLIDSSAVVTSSGSLLHAFPSSTFSPALQRVDVTGSVDFNIIYPYSTNAVETVRAAGTGTTTSVASWPVVGGGSFQVIPDLGMVAWKDWIVGTYQHYLVWTDAGQRAVTSTNYVAIPTAYINTLVPTSDALYIGSSDGWWAVSGVLGESTSVRRVSKVGGGPAYAWNSAAEINNGIVHSAGSGANLRLLAGSQSIPFAVIPSPKTLPVVHNCGDVIVTVNSLNKAYIWSDVRRSWRVSAPTLPGTGTNVLTSMENAAGGAATQIGLFNRNTLSGTETGVMHYQLKDPVQPTVTGGSFDLASVTLADYVRPKEFRVKELLVEIDKGTTSGAGSATRSLAVQVVTYPIVGMAGGGLDDTGSGTSGLTKTFASSDSTAGEREMVRFAINDAGPTFTAKPILGLKGIKVRRVIMRCEEV